MKLDRFLLYIIIPLTLMGCTEKKDVSEQTISLTLVEKAGHFSVTDYRLRNKAYAESSQQGYYQAHLLDTDNKILQKISFDKIELSSAQEQDNAPFYVAVPLLSKAVKIKIYRLDGSSGHYQLKTDNPLLSWQIPDHLKQTKRTSTAE